MIRGRLGIIAVMIVSLVAASFLRQQSVNWQVAESGKAGAAASGSVGGMNSFALALVLGGLRGPLVMYLWSTSETQKSDHDLEDFDTKVEWIRLLQPEFDTVHLFQIWNKAYNISVLMASPANKYTTIMEALQYADSVLKEKPGDINILQAIAGIYSNKLGGRPVRPEEKFYNRQLREESMTDAARKLAYPDDTQFHRLWQNTLALDDQNNIRPELLAPSRPRPADVTGDWNDGSTLQYLAKYGPFPFGISPAALAYNYAKQAQIGQTVDGQKPLQVSPMVIDSRPGLELESWAQQQITLSRLTEGRAFGIKVSEDPDAATDDQLSNLPPGVAARDPAALKLAMEGYDRAISIAEEIPREISRHLHNPAYAMRFNLYATAFNDAAANVLLSNADRDYLRLRLVSGDEAAHLHAVTIAEYGRALLTNERTLLTYYTEDELIRGAFPPHTDKTSIAQFPDQMVLQIFDRVMKLLTGLQQHEFDDERVTYLRDIKRSAARLRSLQAGQ